MLSLPFVFLPIIFTSFIVSYLCTPVIRRICIRFNIVDTPTDRKIHKTPTAKLGGLAIYLAILSAVLISKPIDDITIGILTGATLIVLLGIIDDIFSIHPWVKLAGQITVAILTVSFGISINFVTNPLGGFFYFKWLAIPITILWIVGFINIMNLTDGLDGLASGVAAISAAILAFVAVQTGQIFAAALALSVLGACLGFLRFNFYPAKIFMGDTGSMLLGYMLAVTSIIGVLKSTITISLAIPLLIFGIPISDTFFAIVRRIKNKKNIMHADNHHFHHRLLGMGLSPKMVVFLMYLGCFILGLLALIASLPTGIKAYVVLAFILVFITSLVLLFKKKHAVIFGFFGLI